MKRLLLITISIMCVILFLVPQAAYAAALRSSNNVTIDSGEVINDDLYVSGGTVVVNGKVNGDLIVGGGTVTINGPVRDDLMIGGGNVTVNGTVNQSARISGGTLSVNGKIGQDLLVAGGTVEAASSSSVGRDTLLASGNAQLSGSIGRKLQAAAGNVVIDGPVGGTARLDVSQLRLTDRANIKGDLIYTSENRATIAPGAKISGKTTRHVRPRPANRTGSRILTFVLSFLAAYLFGIVLLALFPVKVPRIAAAVVNSAWISLLVGLALLILVPPAAIILLILVITIPISMTAIFLYILGIYLAKVFVGLAIGKLISGYFKLRGGNALALLIGLFIVMLLGAIPFIGPVLRFIYILFGLGAAGYVIYKAIQERERPGQPAA
ncbi:MAG: bactofilin family protein [Candidatus Aquicultor sp.]